VVWTLPEARAQAIAALPEAAFLGALQQAFGGRLGRLYAAGARTSFALSLVRSHALTAPRVALVGNAANRLHPVAGQGLNLGLRDAAALADVVADAVRAGADPGADAVLAAYARARRPDQRAIVRLTDTLARGFSARPGLLGGLRSAGMLALDLVPPASRALARRAMGLAGRQSRLVRGIAP
jgi:2-octaprenyl-6-methoxyphenol hydroxylase